MCPTQITPNNNMGNITNSELNNSAPREIYPASNSEADRTRLQDTSQRNDNIIQNEEQLLEEQSILLRNEIQSHLQNQTISESDVNIITQLINENNLANEIAMDVDISHDVVIQHPEVSDAQVTTNEPINNRPEMQIDEAVGGSDPTYNFEINRLLSFPDNFLFEIKLFLAKLGFYYIQNCIFQCQFCKIIIEVNSNTIQNQTHTCEKNNNIAIPENTSDFRYEINRLLSFLKIQWNKKNGRHPVGAQDLARWGFYYIGEADACRCIFCRLEVRGWEQGDTAESEHRRWNPECPFISGRIVGNVKLGEEFLVENVVDDCASVITRTNSDGLMVKEVEETKIIPVIPPKHPQFVSVHARLTSYELWPRCLKQRPESLSDAGFFYTDKGDRVICFQCGGGLKDWGDKDPWVEHSYWFPQCKYLNLRKGAEYVKKIQDLKNKVLESTVKHPLPQQKQQVISKDIVEPSIAEIPSFRQCKVCMDKELSIVFLPCGHIAACSDCAPQLSSCPVCRGKLAAYVRAYLP